MKKYLIVLTAALLLGATRGDEPTKPGAAKLDTKKDDRGVLTPEKLGELLRDLAYELKDVSANNAKDVYQVTTETNGWKIFITVSLSTDRTVLWLDVKFNPVADPDGGPTSAWLKLLELSHTHDPIHFTFDDKKRVHMTAAIDNFAITPASLRKEIEKFDAVVRQCEPFWKAANFKPLPKVDVLSAAGRKSLEKLAGTWVVVEEERNGKKTSTADVADSAITYVFAIDKCRIKSKHSKEVEANLWADAGNTAVPLDLVFMGNRVVQKAIVQVDGDTMTLCVANPDVARPTEFAAPAEFKGMMIVLKRQKP